MEKLYNTLISLLDEEIKDLYLGHPFNEDRIAFMKNIISIFLYMRYAVLSDSEISKILQIYEHS